MLKYVPYFLSRVHRETRLARAPRRRWAPDEIHEEVGQDWEEAGSVRALALPGVPWGASASGGSSEERSLRQHTFLSYVLCPRTAASGRAMRLLRLRKDGLSDDGYLEAVGAFSGDASW